MQKVIEFRGPQSEAVSEPLVAPPSIEPILAVVDSLSRTLDCIKTMCTTEPTGPIRDKLETERANLVIGLFVARSPRCGCLPTRPRRKRQIFRSPGADDARCCAAEPAEQATMKMPPPTEAASLLAGFWRVHGPLNVISQLIQMLGEPVEHFAFSPNPLQGHGSAPRQPHRSGASPARLDSPSLAVPLPV